MLWLASGLCIGFAVGYVTRSLLAFSGEDHG